MDQFEPPHISFTTFALKVAAGITSGIAATGILLGLFFATSSILQPVLNPEGITTDTNPLFVVAVILIIFLTTLGANMIGTLLFSLAHREKYQRKSTALTHIFALNIIILLLLLPLYAISSSTSANLTISIGALHVIMGTTASLMIFEVISNMRYALVGIYSTLFALLAGIGLNFLVFEITANWTIVMFTAMPVIWASIGFSSAIVESLYRWVYTTWGKDFLLTTAEYGADYGVQEEPEEAAPQPQTHDEAGSDFLKKNR